MDIFPKNLTHKNLRLAWAVALLVITLLGVFRFSTDAEYAFASAAIIPVFLVAWTGGLKHGLAAAILAVVMWVLTDILSERQFSEAWLPYFNGFIRLSTYCFVAYLTARVRLLLQREIELSTHDALTGLFNRRKFIESGQAEVARAQRYEHSMAVIFLDLDHFKQLNDSQGHDAGDAALKAVGIALGNALRSSDTVARLGGDEFAIILPEIDLAAATDSGHKIAAAVAVSLRTFTPVTASVGVAWFEYANESFDDMLTAADREMYEMKQCGKGGVRIRSC